MRRFIGTYTTTPFKARASPPFELLAFKMASDDEIIRKRLLIDGEGAGDDRRITTLLKSFLKWCNSSNLEEGESDAAYQKIQLQLAQCEFAIRKTQTVFEMNEHETENYEKVYDEIEQSITHAYEEIAGCKAELQQAKRIRRNRQEYDALAKVIAKHPERQETLKQIEELDKELNSLTGTKESLLSKNFGRSSFTFLSTRFMNYNECWKKTRQIQKVNHHLVLLLKDHLWIQAS
ncbi:THO complex subunit 7 homolog isoform X2 [Acropora millepora]|uniref:THO complex subunit 7 homolog isoform X2 n=1 Tax=Acropora millepora TaxID=45264 RepID=UPI001CF519D3|nr:THO complex subunit 7 homolog isoform X2 [Acropora millepora]